MDIQKKGLLKNCIHTLHEVNKREDIHLTGVDKCSQLIPRFLQSLKHEM